MLGEEQGGPVERHVRFRQVPGEGLENVRHPGDRRRAADGVSLGQFELLRYLREHPRSRVADLAGWFAIGVGATSKGVDRLEARGWIRRLPNPADRRSSLPELTEAGAGALTAAERTFEAEAAQLLGLVLTRRLWPRRPLPSAYSARLLGSEIWVPRWADRELALVADLRRQAGALSNPRL
ncbi:HTH-type transcriptional regulator hpr [Actinoplanes sp. SE50]|uniref:MarR family winged helix-turn-helix transcriptional regulator n=1 Tax=unclassified Actinoplanes TaxID=2626549 RepID=UPI00023ECCF5|nr:MULTISPECIES: MarR family transcriptional regulator [unclassified Actinoplanes]AEV85456.1 HTH-type transcriptional regulator hpr [Actinoplanes sp. SE50/110]ATO83849.1 HTH-type transcriptional regulator hpr [Actinoplanes sp. SE50]SLM01259.1 MarR family transcriptional regulator [Actinoplanes sp. SE50/110]